MGGGQEVKVRKQGQGRTVGGEGWGASFGRCRSGQVRSGEQQWDSSQSGGGRDWEVEGG